MTDEQCKRMLEMQASIDGFMHFMAERNLTGEFQEWLNERMCSIGQINAGNQD
jgi:hypothetical protein